MKLLPPLLVLLLTLPAHVLLLTSCSAVSPNSSLPPGVRPAQVEPLSDQHRVSKVKIPLECSPSCSAGLTALRNELATMPTGSASPAKAVKDGSTP